jgi:membrane protease YdiL (CAAX protease family)
MEEGEGPSPRAALAAGVIFEAALALVAFALGALAGVDPLLTLRLDARDAAIGAAATLPMLVFFVVFLKSGAAPFRSIRDALDERLWPVFRHASVTDLAAISALAGIGEELLFRGVIQPALAGYAGVVAGLVATSVIFGLAHSVTRTYAVIATLIGAFLGGLWLLTGNILVPVVAHALYDFVAILLYLRDARRRLPA